MAAAVLRTPAPQAVGLKQLSLPEVRGAGEELSPAASVPSSPPAAPWSITPATRQLRSTPSLMKARHDSLTSPATESVMPEPMRGVAATSNSLLLRGLVGDVPPPKALARRLLPRKLLPAEPAASIQTEVFTTEIHTAGLPLSSGEAPARGHLDTLGRPQHDDDLQLAEELALLSVDLAGRLAEEEASCQYDSARACIDRLALMVTAADSQRARTAGSLHWMALGVALCAMMWVQLQLAVATCIAAPALIFGPAIGQRLWHENSKPKKEQQKDQPLQAKVMAATRHADVANPLILRARRLHAFRSSPRKPKLLMDDHRASDLARTAVCAVVPDKAMPETSLQAARRHLAVARAEASIGDFSDRCAHLSRFIDHMIAKAPPTSQLDAATTRPASQRVDSLPPWEEEARRAHRRNERQRREKRILRRRRSSLKRRQ